MYGYNPMYGGGGQNGQMGAWGQNGGGNAMQGSPGSAQSGGFGYGHGGYASPSPISQSMWPGEQHSSYAQPAAGYQSMQPQGGQGQQGYQGYSVGSSGNAMLDMIQNQTMSNAMGANVGARRSAQNSAPWAAGTAGLNSLIGGQGIAAHSINQGAMGYLQQQQAQQWQEHMARLQSQLQMDQWKQMQPSWGQQLAGIGGQALGAYMGTPNPFGWGK